MLIRLLLIRLLLIRLTADMAAADTSDADMAPSGNSIADIAIADGRFDTLVAAVVAADLAGALSGGEWTVFAPTDDAFAKLGLDEIEHRFHLQQRRIDRHLALPRSDRQRFFSGSRRKYGRYHDGQWSISRLESFPRQSIRK